MQISGQKSGVGGFPIYKADIEDSWAASSVLDISLIWIIVSATGPASVIVPKVVTLGCKIDPPILAVRAAPLIICVSEDPLHNSIYMYIQIIYKITYNKQTSTKCTQ